jgi:hypothetical protein
MEGIPAPAGFDDASQVPLSSSYYESPSHHSSTLRTHGSMHEHAPPPGGLATMLTDLPHSVQSLLLNILLIFLTIYLSNASDYLRGIVHKVRVFFKSYNRDQNLLSRRSPFVWWVVAVQGVRVRHERSSLSYLSVCCRRAHAENVCLCRVRPRRHTLCQYECLGRPCCR